MRCPICKRKLIKAENCVYETLFDNVLNPNREVIDPRPTYICPKQCFGESAFWGINGDLYNPGTTMGKLGFKTLKDTDALESPANPHSCIVCKKPIIREINNWVYHDSVGVVCRHHQGVEAWYIELLHAARKKEEQMGTIFSEWTKAERKED